MEPNDFLGSSAMKSSVVKRSIVIAAHKTSVSLEDAFWKALKAIAVERGTTLSNLVTSIDVDRRQGNLSSSLRLFVLDFYRNKLAEKAAATNAQPDQKAPPEVKSASGST
jgi:predicted DNA-binding ribbon-helix-helix protein